VCARPKEMVVARSMLDHIFSDLLLPPSDHNTYSLGRIGVHNVVIACPPKGDITTSAARVTTQMSSTFTSIRFCLMVGIGGSVPSRSHDIRLGDVTVSMPTDQHGGVIQRDFGKTTKGDRFERTGALNGPPTVPYDIARQIRSNA
jgi:nucleoside phosphorylase